MRHILRSLLILIIGLGVCTHSLALKFDARTSSGSSLPTDPNADGILLWDDSDGASEWALIGSGLAYDGTTLSATTATLTGVAVGDGANLSGVTSSAGIASAITDEVGSGAMVFGTSPVFTTQITAPTVYGGSGTGSDVIIRATSSATHSGSYVLINPSDEGSVGINNATPIYSLDVTGTMHVTGAVSFDSAVSIGGNNETVFGNGNNARYGVTFDVVGIDDTFNAESGIIKVQKNFQAGRLIVSHDGLFSGAGFLMSSDAGVTVANISYDGTAFFTGIQVDKSFVMEPLALTDAATIATDASLGNTFTVTLGGNRTLGTPTNPTNGQKCIWIISQDVSGSRTLQAGPAFRFGTSVSSFDISTTAGRQSYIGAVYNVRGPSNAAQSWDVVASSNGYVG